MPVEAVQPNTVERQAHGPTFVGVSLDAHNAATAAQRRELPAVAIRSWSAVTAFGDLQQTWARLLAGETIGDHTPIPIQAGTGRAAVSLARSAVASACGNRTLDDNAAVIVGTSKGTVIDWLSPPTSDNQPSPLSVTGLSEIATDVARFVRTSGPALTLSAACSSGLHALIRGAMMIRTGEVRQALIVAAEASVHPLFLGSFQRLGILAAPGVGCRPFDRDRTGFYMSEAACAVLLEAEDANSDAPTTSLRVDRFAMGGDATHLTGGDPDAKLLKHLLHKVIDGRPVDLIHAHGTGTVLNDETELAAIESTLGDAQPSPPVIYSHKAALGHSLGASGLLSVVLNCQAHATATIPPNARTTNPLPTSRVVIPQAIRSQPITRSIAIAAGFGGPTAVVGIQS